METKTCKTCGQTLPLEAFSKHKSATDGHMGVCKECRGAAMEAARKKPRLIMQPKNPELEQWSDKDLWAELKARGWGGKIYKEVIAIKSLE